MNAITAVWAVAAMLAGLASPALAQSNTNTPDGSVEKAATLYRVIGISDGDTMTILMDSKPLKLRLANIDAPEKAQPFGERSKQSLSELCFGKEASYQAQGTDKYGRTIAIVFCSGIEANRLQVEQGMAWVYEKYNRDSALPALQSEARSMKRGLWADPNPIPPWQYRADRRSQKGKGHENH